MGTYATTDKGNVDISASGAFVKIQWTDTVLRVRAFSPRYLIAGIDDRTLWILALTERQSAPPGPAVQHPDQHDLRGWREPADRRKRLHDRLRDRPSGWRRAMTPPHRIR